MLKHSDYEKTRQKNPVTYFLPEVPRSSDNHCMGFEILHIYIAGAAHQQLKRLEGGKKKIKKKNAEFLSVSLTGNRLSL